MNGELVDIVDENGRVLRQELKTEAHKYGWLHKTVIGYLKYGEDLALVKQAADKQDAGQLVAPVGGHVSAGETDIGGLLRESKEEIGTSNIKYKLVGEKIFHRQVIGRNENHLFVIYEIRTNDPIRLNAESVGIERFTPAELKLGLAKNPTNFGDAFYFVLESFFSEFLTSSYKYRWNQGLK